VRDPQLLLLLLLLLLPLGVRVLNKNPSSSSRAAAEPAGRAAVSQLVCHRLARAILAQGLRLLLLLGLLVGLLPALAQSHHLLLQLCLQVALAVWVALVVLLVCLGAKMPRMQLLAGPQGEGLQSGGGPVLVLVLSAWWPAGCSTRLSLVLLRTTALHTVCLHLQLGLGLRRQLGPLRGALQEGMRQEARGAAGAMRVTLAAVAAVSAASSSGQRIQRVLAAGHSGWGPRGSVGRSLLQHSRSSSSRCRVVAAVVRHPRAAARRQQQQVAPVCVPLVLAGMLRAMQVAQAAAEALHHLVGGLLGRWGAAHPAWGAAQAAGVPARTALRWQQRRLAAAVVQAAAAASCSRQ
jgi:hypothetical protein